MTHKSKTPILFELYRDWRSYEFRANPEEPDSFANNWYNNSLDALLVVDADTGTKYGSYSCQSVANYCFGEYATADTVSHGDTIVGPRFTVRAFAQRRSFHGSIHEIIDTTDLDGQKIDHQAMQTTANGYQTGRWLIHDRYSFKEGKDTRYAWSAGCFILSSYDLLRLAMVLDGLGVQVGDLIPGVVYER